MYYLGDGFLAGPSGIEDKQLNSTLSAFPWDGIIECPLVLAVGIPLFLMVSSFTLSSYGADTQQASREGHHILTVSPGQ